MARHDQIGGRMARHDESTGRTARRDESAGVSVPGGGGRDESTVVSAGDEPVRLSRNRDYNILWTSMFLSELAGEIVFVAFPLLLLAHSASAVQIGLITSILAAARMAVNVPAGVIADRWDRKRVLLLSQAVRSAAMFSIVIALLLGVFSFPHVVLVAVIEGAFSSVFQPAEHAALPQVVPGAQLPDALARNAARPFGALLLGPAAAGFTFGLHELVPFSIDAGMLAVSFAALTVLRLPRRRPAGQVSPGQVSPGQVSPGRPSDDGLLSGFRWLLRQPVIRTTVVWIVFVNLAFHALIIIILVQSGEAEVAYGEIGLMMACFGVGGLLGAMVAGRLHAALPAPVIIIGASWVFAAMAGLMALVSRGLLLGVLLGLAAVFFPVANTTIVTYQLTIAPDEIRGRLSGVVGLCSDLAGTVGPMAGGLLIAVTGDGAMSILICAAALGIVALGANLSPTLRHFPTLRPAPAAPET
ncbi:MFS transporter [Nonomuraea sp. NPDC049269]|uniref:MFS transporter n=1 Tax=Nonomuraea sp. NPDC049269 TaxID=3364349 RepID=UPI00371FDC2C